MCGIIGIDYGPDGPMFEDWTPSEILQIMLPASVHRGPHAFGWMYCTKDGVIHVDKHQGRSDTRSNIELMVIDPEVEKEIVWLVGHVRYYTHGSPDNMHNNHPIDHGKIVGVHNGVLRNHAAILEDTGRQYDDTEVDSEAIFAAVDKWGHRKGLRRIRGDMVTVYANRERPEVLHLARTFGRELFLTHTTGGSILFASEEGIAEATGMADSPYSRLSANRLIRLKNGKVVERINLFPPNPPKDDEAWRYTGDDDTEGGTNFHNTWQGRGDIPVRPGGGFMYQPRIVPPGLNLGTPSPPKPTSITPQSPAKLRAQRGTTGQPNQNQKALPVVRNPNPVPGVTTPGPVNKGYARSTQFRDGDRVGNKFYYRGLLLTEADFLKEVNHPRGAKGKG